VWKELCHNIAIANKTKDTRILKKSIRIVLEKIDLDDSSYYRSEWRKLCEQLYDDVRKRGNIIKTIETITSKFFDVG
jgi:hypothetical protein